MGKGEEERSLSGRLAGVGPEEEGGESLEGNAEAGCRQCRWIGRAVRVRCLAALALGMAVLLSAVFWLPPFLRDGADLEGLDSQIGTNIIASFQLPKPVAELKVNIQELQYDIFEEIGVANCLVTIISLDALQAKNWTNVVFGVWPYPKDSNISSAGLSILKSNFVLLVTEQSTLRLTSSLFGNPSFFQVLEFPGGITIIPPQSAFLLQKPQTLFNFTLNFSIYEVYNKISELKDQMTSGLHLTYYEAGSEAIFFRSAFKNVIFAGGRNLESEIPSGHYHQDLQKQDSVVVQFKISCPCIEEGTTVFVTGSASGLGHWDSQKGLRLFYAGDSIWQADCVMRKDDLPIKYKYSQSRQTGDTLLEVGPNRELTVDSMTGHPPNYVYLSDGNFRQMPWRGAGVAIPMFSVRSDDDLGVGEFLDLKLLVDWAVDSGFHLIQLLPVNDTSVHGMWWDSYPYSSLSVFALHPLYLRVQALSKNIPEEIKQEILMAKRQLDGEVVDYEATMATKLSIAKKFFSLEKEATLSSSSFLKFFSDNEEWLRPYAAFCFLRDFFETSDHSQWGRFANYSEEKLEKIVSKDSLQYDIICFHYYIQFHLHLQLSETAEYARKKKVVLKGDLPIGVDRNSVDTWVYPNLFRMNTSTGAPPDYFDKNGQNWGFPTYNWEEMSKDNYAWWRARLTQMSKYFTAYRIDHILGFFRIWELPDHAITGLVGKFRPSIALSQEELEREGIWDFDRLSCPYVCQEMLQDKFGTFWPVVAAHFLNECKKDCYEFKEDSNTEKKIMVKLKSSTGKSLWLDKESQILKGLIELLQNIVLIRDPEDGRKFHPRFNLEETTSFRDLDEHSKRVLSRLYYDYYFSRQEGLWRQNALKTLPVLLNSSDMLACGEDLGLIPSCVHPVMQELGLIGLRIQRMPSEPGIEFGVPSQYSYMTVCAPSCHDCSTMRAWWEEDETRRCRFHKTVVGSTDTPPSQCDPHVAHFILKQHLDAPSMWAIFPLQDLLALKEEYATRPAAEETINDPTNPKHYWRYRVHVALQSLLGDNKIKEIIKDLVKCSGRSYPTTEAGENQDHLLSTRVLHGGESTIPQLVL